MKLNNCENIDIRSMHRESCNFFKKASNCFCSLNSFLYYSHRKKAKWQSSWKRLIKTMTKNTCWRRKELRQVTLFGCESDISENACSHVCSTRNAIWEKIISRTLQKSKTQIIWEKIFLKLCKNTSNLREDIFEIFANIQMLAHNIWCDSQVSKANLQAHRPNRRQKHELPRIKAC